MEMGSSGEKVESPRYAKMSLASAISLGLARGWMYRGAVNRCVNLLVHYPEGCKANCAYCGLARKRPGTYREKSFIHVDWPLFSMDEVVAAINSAPAYVKRTCISMITNGKCRKHTMDMTRRLKEETSLPVSILLCPTVLHPEDLMEMKEKGAEKVGIAIDLATPELFEKYRGRAVSGPHRWRKYWETLETAVKVFGHPHVGAHLMVGMGETEEEMISLMDRLNQMRIMNHLFSFFAEEDSRLAQRPQPPWPSYLRVQLARYLIEEDMSHYREMEFDSEGRVMNFGLSIDRLERIIGSGLAFMTTGCSGPGGRVDCNRPFGNCLPGVRQWNYPYPPNEEERDLIRKNVFN